MTKSGGFFFFLVVGLPDPQNRKICLLVRLQCCISVNLKTGAVLEKPQVVKHFATGVVHNATTHLTLHVLGLTFYNKDWQQLRDADPSYITNSIAKIAFRVASRDKLPLQHNNNSVVLLVNSPELARIVFLVRRVCC
ncbi:hypothetical protein LY78DRAFT_141418 [Colletotrichum sublineola]|nr:hypothetical protein LY78DRAFT_141418 [Colletotrichum sublineola]